MEFSNPNNARKINRLRVLNALFEKDNITRAELSRILVLNKISISEIVLSLIEEGLIFEAEKGSTTKEGGRPGTTLKLNKDKALVLAADIGASTIRIAIADLSGKIIRYEQIPINPKDDLASQIADNLKRILKTADKEILALGICIDGIADDEKGIVEIRNLDTEKPYPIKQELLKRGINIPIVLTQQLRAQVLGEKMFFKQTLESFLFINWGEYISSAFVTKTQIMENMEFGHLNISDQGLCHCGSIGCLNLSSSGWGYKKAAIEKIGKSLSVKQLQNTEEGELILKKGIEKMGKALAMAICITGAKAVIMGGGISALSDYYFSYLEECLQLSLPSHLINTPLYRGNFKEKGAVQGTVYHTLDICFYSRSLLCALGYTDY